MILPNSGLTFLKMLIFSLLDFLVSSRTSYCLRSCCFLTMATVKMMMTRQLENLSYL